MSTAAKTIDRVIRIGLAPCLKAEGFKKQARNFYRESEIRVDVVNIQSSCWNDGACGHFTMNLGVYFPRVAAVTGGPLAPKIPKEYHCSVRARIGLLMPKRTDLWWEVSNQTDEASLAKKVPDAWQQFGKPWLESVASYAGARAILISGKSYFMAAAVSLVMDERSEAEALLPKALLQQPLAAGKIQEWAKVHKLAVHSAA